MHVFLPHGKISPFVIELSLNDSIYLCHRWNYKQLLDMISNNGGLMCYKILLKASLYNCVQWAVVNSLTLLLFHIRLRGCKKRLFACALTIKYAKYE